MGSTRQGVAQQSDGPPCRWFWGSVYSSTVLYINSSSSRASPFLWTSRFSCMLTTTCVAPKYVGQRAQSAGLTDNNFVHRPSSVDNCLVAPKIFPGLSTWGPKIGARCVGPAGSPRHAKTENPAVLRRTRGFLEDAVGVTGPVAPCASRGVHHAHRGRGDRRCRQTWHPCDGRAGSGHQKSFAARASGRRRRFW